MPYHIGGPKPSPVACTTQCRFTTYNRIMSTTRKTSANALKDTMQKVISLTPYPLCNFFNLKRFWPENWQFLWPVVHTLRKLQFYCAFTDHWYLCTLHVSLLLIMDRKQSFFSLALPSQGCLLRTSCRHDHNPRNEVIAFESKYSYRIFRYSL